MSPLRRMFAAVALALVLAPLLAAAPLFDPDEGLHAAIAQEMVQRRDYVTPTFRGEPFLDKPILFFWAEAASLRLFGDTPAAVRIPPLLFGLFGMVTVALLGRALFGEPAGLIAGIAYGTMLLPMGVSEVAVHDVGLAPFMCIAALCLLQKGNSRTALAGGAVAGVALGLSILTKGLVGVVFTGIFAVCLAVREPAAWLRLALVLALAVVVAVIVAAPWYVAMEHAHPGYLHYYFIERHLQGYLTATQRHAGRPFWYYLPIVLGGALPWTPYLALAGRAARRASTPAEDARRRSLRLTLWGWFAIGFVFLSIGESKLVTYALPLFPALALIVGEHLAPDRRPDPRVSLALAAHVTTLALLPAAGLLYLEWKYGATHLYLWVVLAVLGLLTIVAGRRAARATSEHGFMAGVVRMTLCAIVAMTIVAPHAAAWMTSRDLARTLNQGGTLPPRVTVLDERIGSLIFYLEPRLRAAATPERVSSTSLADAMGRLRGDPPDAILAVRNHQLARFERLFPAPPRADALSGTFSLFRADTLRAALRVR